MVDIVATNSVSTQTLMENIELYKTNPSAIQQTVLDYLEAVTNAEVDVVDPTNPFVFLLESSAVNTAVAVTETHLATRKQYPALAQTEEELYMHMSDKDFIGRFASPCETMFTFLVDVNTLLGKMVYDHTEKCGKVTIARNTEVMIEDWVFSLEYPIHIRRFDNGVVQVSYDTQKVSPLRSLPTNIIDYVVTQNADGTQWLKFSVPMTQFKVESTEFPVQTSMAFNHTVVYEDSYYHCRVFYKKGDVSDEWVEMKTTHTDQVYDPFTPTAVLKVLTTQQTLEVFIPSVYINSETVDGTIRVDVYTTKGELTVDMNNYRLESFTTHLKAIDEVADTDDYTTAMNDVVFLTYSDRVVSGGNKELSFLDLRERVINNATGDRQLPITNVQLKSNTERAGFTIVPNVDLVTNRIFIATKNLPNPSNTRLITPANITVETLVCSMDDLKPLAGVFDNGDRVTLSSSLLYMYNNGKITIVPKSQVESFQRLSSVSLSELSKQVKFLYSPFHYVLDDTLDEFELRGYYLDRPKLSNMNFVSQNPTVQLPVNTGSYEIEKTELGYKIRVVTKSGNFYKELNDAYVGVQLAFVPMGENSQAYLNGVLLGKTEDGERVYEFTLLTNHDIDNNNWLYFDNFKMSNADVIRTPAELTSTFRLYYTTSSQPVDFVSSQIDTLIGKAFLPLNSVGVTHETITVTFGYALKNLWSQSRSVAAGLEFERYTQDIPMLYSEDVYEIDPVTGNAFSFDSDNNLQFNILHYKGDVVRDESGDVVYAHRKGDVVLDENYKARVIGQLDTLRHCDLLFVDGNYYFSTDSSYVNYRVELADTISEWIHNNLSVLNDNLLEQTKIYYYPKKSIGTVKVALSDNNETTLESQQSLVVDLYVRDSIFKDLQMREEIRRNTVKYLNTAIQSAVVSISQMTADLRTQYDSAVVSFQVSGLGGEANYEVLSVLNGHEQLCLKKHLVAQDDGTLIVSEDVTVNFINFNEA